MKGTDGTVPRWVGLLWILALAVGIYLLAPPEREGASQIHLARARVMTGAVELGETAPVFPGATIWTGALLASVQQVSSLSGRPDGQSWLDYVRGQEGTDRTVLRWAFALLAALVLLRTVEVGAETTGRRRAVVALWVGLALGPYLLGVVSRLGPGLLAGWMVLELTLPWLRQPPRATWTSATAGGVLLAFAPFLWPVLIPFLAAGFLVHRPIGNFAARLLLLVLLAAALDPSRLLHLQSGLELAWLEWTRAGGFPTVGTTFGGGSLKPVGLAFAAILLGVLGWGLWLWRRRSLSRGAGIWLLGILGLVVLGPGIAGVDRGGPVQESVVPMLALGIVLLVGETGRLPKLAQRLLPAVAALWLTLAWLPLFTSRPALDPAVLGEQILTELQFHLGDGLLLSERGLPGEVSLPKRSFLLPRDSRHPERYDFVYWPRWYVDFDYVLLSAGQVRQNLQRGGVPAHFYGQLLEDSDLVTEWGGEGQGGEVLYRLYRIRDGADWQDPLRTEDLADLTPVPELGPFLSQLGAFAAEAGHLRTAVIIFEEGFRLAPESISMYNNLGSLYLLEEEWESAAKVLTKGLARAPKSTEMLFNSGRAHYELGSFERAEQLLRRTVNLRPEFSDAHYELGRAFLVQDKKELAQMALQNYLDLEPDSPRRESVLFVLDQLRGGSEESARPDSTLALEESERGQERSAVTAPSDP